MISKLSNLALVASLICSASAFAAEQSKQLPPQVLFKNVHVWDGTSDGLTKKIDVLVEGNSLSSWLNTSNQLISWE